MLRQNKNQVSTEGGHSHLYHDGISSDNQHYHNMSSRLYHQNTNNNINSNVPMSGYTSQETS